MGATVRVVVPQVTGNAESTFDMTVTELDGRRAARIIIRPAGDDAAERPVRQEVPAAHQENPAGGEDIAATGQAHAVDAAGDR